LKINQKKYIQELEEAYIFHEQAAKEVELHVAVRDREAGNHTGEANPDI
jgi:hypothetical protein